MNVNVNDLSVNGYIDSVRALIADGEKSACVITLGCQQNEADSEKIRAMAQKMGYTLTDSPECADLIIVNTCAVRRHAELKALSIVGNFKAYKKSRPDLVVGVCGCMAAEPHIAEQIKRSFHHVSFTLEPAMIHKLPELVHKTLTEHRRSFVFGLDEGDIVEGIGAVRQSKHRAWVSVMYGCNNFCSYCIVPYVRGRERSRDSADILRECHELVDAGYKEITLLGQNVNSYKSDMTFAELISEVASIPGDFIVRFMTSHPKDASDELILAMGRHKDKIAPAFHLPLQSGSDPILKAMNRTYDMKKYLDTVRKIRETVPGVALSSDIIVGFPGETDEDFKNTMDALKSVRFDMVFSFNYSPREGTRAAKMDSQVPEETKKVRMTELLDVQCEISREINETYVGGCERVLVDSYEEKDGVRTYNARTLTNKLVHFTSSEELVGQFVNVKIIKAGAFDLLAEIER